MGCSPGAPISYLFDQRFCARAPPFYAIRFTIRYTICVLVSSYVPFSLPNYMGAPSGGSRPSFAAGRAAGFGRM